MKKLILFLIVLLAACGVFAQEADLVYKFKENTHHNFKEKINVKINATVFGESIESVTETVIDIDETILNSGEKGKVKQTSKVTASSIDGKDNLEQVAENEKETTVIYEVDKRGKTLSLTDADGKAFEEFNADGETPIFPDKKVKVGDSWDWKRNIDNIKVNGKCTLEKLYSKDGVDIAKINIVFDDVIKENNDVDPDLETTVKGTGVFYYAINYGNDLYLSYTVDFETNMEAEIDGNTGEANMKTNYNYVYWRCK